MKSNLLMMIIKPLTDALTPSCQIISQQISRSMDEPLTRWERFQVKLHLVACKLCTLYRDQLLAIRKMIREQTEEQDANSKLSDFRLSPEKREQLKEKLRDHSSDSIDK